MPDCLVCMDGELVPHHQAVVHIGSAAMKYGASVFEGIRGYWSESRSCLLLLAVDAHLKRLRESAKLMRMDCPWTADRLRAALAGLAQANSLQEDSYFRVAASITGQGGIDTTGPVLLSIVQSRKARHSHYQTGVTVSISSTVRINDTMMSPRLKCVANYQNGRLAKLLAAIDGYEDSLLLNHQGYVAEAPTACICFVCEGRVVTPMLSDGILPSITRALVFQIAHDLGIPMLEKHVTRTDCYLADEAFLCGTGVEILPVVSIDRHKLGPGSPGEITKRLQRAYEEVARGVQDSHRYPGWAIPIG